MKFFTIVFILLMTSGQVYASGCPDGLGNKRHSVLWDGNYRWSGEWTRHENCSSTWTVIWECSICNRKETQVVTMVSKYNNRTGGRDVTITTPNCTYAGQLSPYSEIISGNHSCGSKGGTFSNHPGVSLKKDSTL